MRKRVAAQLLCTAYISAGFLGILAIVAEHSALIPARYKIEAIIICMIIVFILAHIFTRFFTKRAIFPYEKFTESLDRALKDGQFDISGISGYPEFIIPAQSFNDLMLKLQSNKGEALKLLGQIESLISSVEDGIFMVDHNMEIVLYNKHALNFLGIKSLGGSRNILHLFRDSEFEILIRSAVRNKESSSTDSQRGTRRFRMHVSPASGGGAVLLIIDITELYKLERARSDFIENVTHELKTPMTAISGFCELIAEGMLTDTETIRDNMKKAYTEAIRMTRLIEDILRLSEIEHGITGEIETLDIGEIFQRASDTLTELAVTHGVSISIDGDGTVNAQNEHIFELCLNLLSNAIRYNKHGGNVRVNIFETDTHTGFSVTDTGIGIPPEHIERIFERFYRVDKARSRDTGGTGLGLSIVKHIVSKYKGSVKVKSTENGTVFNVLLPK